MQYTPHYNLNLPEGSDIVNPLIQDNPNYTAIDTAMYNNKLRVVETATHVKTGTNHAITLGDSDINQFKFVATGDYATGDTFTVDGVTVTARIADGSTIVNGAFKINSTVFCILDGTILNLININGEKNASDIYYDPNNTVSDMFTTSSEALNVSGETIISSATLYKYGKLRILTLIFGNLSVGQNDSITSVLSLNDRPRDGGVSYDVPSYGGGSSYRVQVLPNGKISIFASVAGTPNMIANIIYLTN